MPDKYHGILHYWSVPRTTNPGIRYDHNAMTRWKVSWLRVWNRLMCWGIAQTFVWEQHEIWKESVFVSIAMMSHSWTIPTLRDVCRYRINRCVLSWVEGVDGRRRSSRIVFCSKTILPCLDLSCDWVCRHQGWRMRLSLHYFKCKGPATEWEIVRTHYFFFLFHSNLEFVGWKPFTTSPRNQIPTYFSN